ncbi:MAG: COX15/CtaA family protein, partial [Acetobacteraceae bacterium]|nr:COX15/CtaA family protein [Acetobacteraceae bacterium]
MSLDPSTFAPRGRSAAPSVAASVRPAVSLWLFSVAGMVLVMVVLGGATRLTGSGLSIMEWAPIAGALPPLSDAEWQRLFALYQRIPQYALVNAGLSIDGFKQIFWLEWVHRVWGRLTGFAVFLPLIWFWAKGWLTPALRSRLLLIFVLGALQGAVGWFMVASGFMPDTVSVSPCRLVIHLMLAVLIYGTIVWTALDSLPPPQPHPAPRGTGRPARAIAALCCARSEER